MPAQENIKITRQGSNTVVYTALVKKKSRRPSLCLQCGVPQFCCFCGASGICRMLIVKCEGWYVEVKVFQSIQLKQKKYVRSWVTCSSSLLVAILNCGQRLLRQLDNERFHALSSYFKFEFTRRA